MQKFILLGLISLFFAACMNHEADLTAYDCTNQNPSYSVDIQPIMAAHCSNCHGGANPSDDLDLSTYANVKEHAQHKRFWGAIEHSSKYEAMPKGAAKLTDSLILKIACWAKNGSPQ